MLSNVEKEKLVIDLYYNQRKNVRQIAQEARGHAQDDVLDVFGTGTKIDLNPKLVTDFTTIKSDDVGR